MTKLTSETVIEIDDDFTTTWAEFADANRDGMDEGELEEIEAALAESGHYDGGGGALASYTLRVLKPRPVRTGYNAEGRPVTVVIPERDK